MKLTVQRPVSVKFDADILEQIGQASTATRLSQVETIRQAVRLGLPKLITGFPRPEAIGFVMTPELARDIEAAESANPASDMTTRQLRKRLLNKR
ncbi:MAG: hypothetical protein WCO56_09505 [Verrucomicrobiota bacterium]